MQDMSLIETKKKHLNVNLIVPNLMPDEFYPGYYSRFLKLNGVYERRAASMMFNEAIYESSPHLVDSHPIFKIASLLGIPFEELFRRHTLVQIVKTTGSLIIQHDNKLSPMYRLLNRRVKSTTSFCSLCADEDLNYWGFSYWRRSHQLPGSNWCSKHGSALCEVDEIKKLDHSPLEYYQSGQFELSQMGLHGYENTNVQKLNELVQDYCDGEFELKQKEISQLFRQQADKIGIRYQYSSKSRIRLIDLVIEKFPEVWLEKHLPSLKTNYYMKLEHTFDSQKKSKIFDVLLVASILFPDDVEILSSIENYNCLPRFTKTPDSKLIEGYLQTNGHHTNTARLLGLDQAHVAKRLPTLSCPSLINKKNETLTALKEFYAGKNIKEVINNENLDIDEFSRIIRIASAHLKDAIQVKN